MVLGEEALAGVATDGDEVEVEGDDDEDTITDLGVGRPFDPTAGLGPLGPLA